jgi:hypothetical protein
MLQRRKALFEGTYRRIGVAGIDITRNVTGKFGRSILCRIENKAGGSEYGFPVLALW